VIDIRDNLRVLFLVALCFLAALALFGPLGASGGETFGGDPPTPDPEAIATTDGAGEYGIELPTGEFDVLVDAVGYERFEANLEVTAGNTTTLDIDLSGRETGTVSGVVTGPDRPVSNATVQFRSNESGDLERTATTGADGSYEVTLATGDYEVRVNEVGFELFTDEVSVGDGGESLDIALAEADTGTVEGVVTNGESPLAGIEVAAVNNQTGTVLASATTGQNGTYALTLETGRATLVVDNLSFETSRVQPTISSGETTTANLTLAPVETTTVEGTVTSGGDPRPDIGVQFRDAATGEQLAVATTGADGTYTAELPVGEYEVVVDELLFERVSRELSLNGSRQVDIQLNRLETGTVEGVVTDGNGGISGIDVQFIDPGAGLGAGTDVDTFPDPTNLQYGLELSGGARIRGQLVGLTAEGIGLNAQDSFQTESDIADQLGLDPIDVRTRPDLDAVELYTDNVTTSEFRSALDAAGLDAANADIREGVTGPTRQEAVTTITERVDQTGFSGADVFTSSAVTGENFIVAEVPGVTRSELRQIIGETGRVQIIAGFPERTENGTLVYNQTELLTQDNINDIEAAQSANAQNPNPNVPISLTTEAGERFANVLQEAGFTDEGIGNCFFDAEVFDAPARQHRNQYCLFTVVDGEYVYGSSLAPGLASTIESGTFPDNPQFIMQTGSFEEAQQLEVNLRSGELPTEVEIVTESFISPSLAQLFKPLALLTALMAWLAVSAVVYFWYRDVRVAVPMLVTAASEVFLLLGFASVVGLALDLSHIAGLIAVIGTGLDDLIIMADEILQRKEKVETGRVFQSRFRKAFWVIGMAAATTIIAMSPLAVLSLGDLQGFAIVTIVGVLIGVGVTRPAYGDVLRKLMLDDVDRS
jgi:preprotein translocase subunit SecD